MKTIKISKMIIYSFVVMTFVIHQKTAAQALQTINFSNEGTYEVPVNDPSLTDSAVFTLKKIRVTQNNDVLKVKYLVPVELTGHKNVEEFEGPFVNGEGTLRYGKQQMGCKADNVELMCNVAYSDLNLNQLKAENILSRKFQGEELQKRLSVQKGFSTDPVGIIRIKLKKAQ